MRGDVTFDTINDDADRNHVEGCYRINGEDWKVFYFTHCINGEIWSKDPIIRKEIKFHSGILGVDVVLPKSMLLNNETVKTMLSEILKITEWQEVYGPDSLQLK